MDGSFGRFCYGIVLAVFVWLMPACAPVYAPNAINAPLLREQGALYASGGVGTNGTDVQSAVALTDHLGLMVNGASYFYDDLAGGPGREEDYRQHVFGEAAVGYFGRLPGRLHWRYEVFAGYGAGRGEATDFTPGFWFIFPFPATVERAEGRFRRLFVQGSAGRVLFDRVEVIGSLRLAHVRFYELETETDTETGGTESAGDEATGFFIEPAGTLRSRGSIVGFSLQAGLSFPWRSAEARGFENQPLFLSAGIHLRLDRLW